MKKVKRVVVLITHSIGTFGPDEALVRYLVDKKVNLYVLQHALKGGVEKNRHYFFYEGGALREQRKTSSPYRGVRQYLSDWLTTLHYVRDLTRVHHIKLLIGVNPLNFFAAYWAKVRPDASIFYSIDYSPQRFPSPLLNALYRFCDRQSAKLADLTLNVSRRAIAARIKDGAPANRMIYTPNGVDAVRRNLKKNKIVMYVGTISQTKGLALVLEAWKLVHHKVPKAKLVIVGTGPDETLIRTSLQQDSLSNSIDFLGKKSHKDVMTLVAGAQVGVAMYNESESYTWYCDPMKVKEYISLLTIPIISSVPEISKDIIRFKAGMVANDSQGLAKAIVIALNKPEQFKQGILKMQKTILWSDIFDRALKKYDKVLQND